MKLADATMLYYANVSDITDIPKFFVVRFTYLTTNRGEDVSETNKGAFRYRRDEASGAFYDSLTNRYQNGNPDNFKRSPQSGYFSRAVLVKGWGKIDRIDINLPELKV